MHARHRNPGNGYKSSARGHILYNSDYRSFNNGGFVQGDILMEAGRLAAEYLVSMGLIPQSTLPLKWQNGAMKKQIGDYQRNHGKGRRRGEYYQRNNCSEWGREYERSGSWLDRSDNAGDNDTCTEQQSDMESGVEQNNSDEMGSKASTSKASDDVMDCNLEDTKSNNGADKQIVPNHSGKHGSDLLRLSKFAKVPTKIRSALACRVPKANKVLNIEEVKTSEKGSDVSAQDNIVAPNTTHDSELSKEVPVQPSSEVGDLSSTIGGVQGKCIRSQSFPDTFLLHNSEQGVPTFGRSTSVKERGDKRNAEDSDINDLTKRPREWLSNLSQSQSQESSRDEMASSEQPGIVAVEPGTGYPQEKKLSPSSFKICDLNLMEASDINDNHCNDQILMCPSMTTEAAQTGIKLSTSNSDLSHEFNRFTGNGKNIEVIDLEDDSIEEDNKAIDDSQRTENDARNAGDNYDGLISEYLFPNCSVAEDIIPLQNEIGLDNGEGTLGDDDSIYMSLGEIPLSFIPAWEQQPQNEYGKPF